MKLQYNVPPSKLKLKKAYWKNSENFWEQASLPIGNGSIGMSVFGDVKSDKIVLNQKTLWAGGPSPKRPDYCGGNITQPDENGKLPYEYQKDIYEAFLNGDNSTADKLCEKLVGIYDGYGGYRCWGELDFSFNDVRHAKNYIRELDMNNGICNVSYSAKSGFSKTANDNRTFFVSYPDNCGVIHFTRDTKSLNFSVKLSSAHGKAVYKNNEIIHSGELEDNGLRFCLIAKFITDGKIETNSNGIKVTDSSECTIIFSADTDYVDSYPTYRTGESSEQLFDRVQTTVKNAVDKGYSILLDDHKKDFSELFNRVNLSLNSNCDLTSDKVLYKYRKNADYRKKAIELLYEYGRYLLISSSRSTDVLPSNLQGIWNVSNNPKWSSDFHININLQMNYWPVFNGNLAECSHPLIRYIKSMVEPGRITAKYYTGIESKDGEQNGFLFHTQCTPFGWTCPGWSFDWGWSPAAVPWILHNCYEHYEYTLDKNVLENDIYPMLKECAEYFSKLLIEHKGRLLTCPCYSPEHGPRTIGNTYEQALIWQLYDDSIKSAVVLGVDNDLVEKWKEIQQKLKVYEIGDDGQIKEWYHEKKLGEFGQHHHRHMSHLLGLFPCNVMNKAENPELIDAAVVSMNHRTDKSTGWSMGQKINTWARVGDGDRVLKIMGDLFKNGIYPNFYDYHPPFQIDGNFGFTSGVNEMLMQSNCGFIELLPALPTEWNNGCIDGIVARGNFTLRIEWSNGILKSATITSNSGEKCKLYYSKCDFIVDGIKSIDNMIEFETEKGKTYFIKPIK